MFFSENTISFVRSKLPSVICDMLHTIINIIFYFRQSYHVCIINLSTSLVILHNMSLLSSVADPGSVFDPALQVLKNLS